MDNTNLIHHFWEYCIEHGFIQSIQLESLPKYESVEHVNQQFMDDIAKIFHIEENLFWNRVNDDVSQTAAELKVEFEKNTQQLKELLESAALFMRHELKLPKEDVNRDLVNIHIKSIQTALHQYPNIYQSASNMTDSNRVTLLLIATNALIFGHLDSITALNAFYDIPHIKRMIRTIFNSFVWYSKQNFVNIDPDLTRSYDSQRRKFSHKIKRVEQMYWQDFPERLQALKEQSAKLQKKMSGRLITPNKKKKLYQQYQEIQNEINHPFFSDEEGK